MVKKKGAREMNPADAHRKAQRAKEIARNKKERKFQRDAHSLQADPDAIKDELKEVLALEEDGKGNQTVRLKKKALQGAYDNAIKKRKEEELKKFQPIDELQFSTKGGHGVLERRPEDSVYYHPTLNPTGIPPAGKPQRYKTSASSAPSNALAALPKPKPPPLPTGPAPQPAHPPEQSAAEPLPPPSGPAPNGQPLPPPAGPPPGVELRGSNGAALPPPAGPPPEYRPFMPPPMGPPPGMLPSGVNPHLMRPPLPPPNMPPPGYMMPPSDALPGMHAQPHAEHKEAKSTIQAASTVIKIPRADQDRTVTSMVPASLRVRRDAAAAAAAAAARPKKGNFPAAPSAAPRIGSEQAISSGVQSAPSAAPVIPSSGHQGRPSLAGAGVAFDRKYEAFMHEMADLGALGS